MLSDMLLTNQIQLFLGRLYFEILPSARVKTADTSAIMSKSSFALQFNTLWSLSF